MIDEMAIVYDVRHGKARKTYVCCECGGTIRGGELYFHHFGIWSWGPEYFKVCEDCEELRTEVDREAQSDDEKTAFTQLSESVFNSHEQEWINRYLAIKRKRGATIPHWMLKLDEDQMVPRSGYDEDDEIRFWIPAREHFRRWKIARKAWKSRKNKAQTTLTFSPH